MINNRHRVLPFLVFSCLVAAAACGSPNLHAAIFSVKDYGASGDGHTVNTKAIQATIDAAAAAGGGMVTISKGVYLTGALFIKSNTEFSGWKFSKLTCFST